MARLVRVKGPLEGDVFPIAKGLTLGRERHNDLAMPMNRKCSRDHCKIWEVGRGKYAVADLGSTNGTLLNDAKTTRGDLADGDHVQVGEVVFRFELDDDEKPKPRVRKEEGAREDFAAILRGEKKREDKPLAASIEGHAAIQIKERILQYQKKSKKGSQLGWDLTQMSGGMRWLLVLVALAGGVALFLLFMNLARG